MYMLLIHLKHRALSRVCFLLFPHQSIRYGYSFEVLLMSTHNLCFVEKLEKCQQFLVKTTSGAIEYFF